MRTLSSYIQILCVNFFFREFLPPCSGFTSHFVCSNSVKFYSDVNCFDTPLFRGSGVNFVSDSIMCTNWTWTGIYKHHPKPALNGYTYKPL